MSLQGKTAVVLGASAEGGTGWGVAEGLAGAGARAVHEGIVAFAAPFAGFGVLVIVDHGASAFTLYGHLSEATVAAGAVVKAGEVVGRVGLAPAGDAALYFEVRIDGRPVDPVEWLARPRR